MNKSDEQPESAYKKRHAKRKDKIDAFAKETENLLRLSNEHKQKVMKDAAIPEKLFDGSTSEQKETGEHHVLEEARQQFVRMRRNLCGRLKRMEKTDEELFTFFKELQDEYHKLILTKEMPDQVDPASMTQQIGAQLWCDFITKALEARELSHVPLLTYLSHAVAAEDNYAKNPESTTPLPEVHTEIVQKAQEFIDASDKTVKREVTKSDLMLSYEAALGIIQEQTKTILNLQDICTHLQGCFSAQIGGTASDEDIANLTERIASGDLNPAEHIGMLQGVIATITRGRRLDTELLQNMIDELHAKITDLNTEIQGMKDMAKDDTKLVKAQEILRMGLLLSISDEFDDAVRQFLQEEEDAKIIDCTPVDVVDDVMM